MSDQFGSGIGQTARSLFTPDSQTPSALGGATGVHLATIVDDIDEAKGGRVWVYIPGISARNMELKYDRYTPTREPRKDDGTPGDPIPEKRSGFIQAYPLSPHSGSDKMRESPKQPDGRNPPSGQSNSYGDFAQGRNGDTVAVCFLNGDPAKCYVMGHIPKVAETDMIPGHKPATTDASGSGYATNIGPSYNKGDDNKDTKPSSLFFNNLTDSGLISDPIRGGTHSSTRESPSRVRGMKTPGDPDTMMAGHQFVMDDHPDSQLIRLRTSKGAQMVLSDSGDFVYFSTATGKTWFEIDDGGNCHVFASSSVNIHAEEDFNLVCDRDFNLHVNGNANMVIKGDTRIRMNQGGNITAGEGGGDLDITTINNLHIKTQGEIRMGAKTGFTAKSDKAFSMQSAEDMTMKSAKAINSSSESTSTKSSKGMLVQSGEGFGLKAGQGVSMKAAGGDFNMDTSANMNATKGSLDVEDAKTVEDAQVPNQADIPLEHSVASGPSKSGPPTSPTGMTKAAAPVVPQHEPWYGHRFKKSAHNAAANPSSIPKLMTT